MIPFLAITPYGRDGSSARVRVMDWIDRVIPDAEVYDYIGASNNSFRTIVTSPRSVLLAEASLRAVAQSGCQRLLLHRSASPFGWGGLEKSIADSAEFCVYDFDDALQWDDGGRARLASWVRSNVSKCVRSIQSVDRVIAGNETLADWAGQFARDVVVIPSCVDPTLYEAKARFELSDPPRLVWIGSLSTEKYLLSIEEALVSVHRRTGARLTIIGSAHGRLGKLAMMVDRMPWGLGVGERMLATYDVGIGPLTDDMYSRGKCAYKLLQYGAAGLPFVASPIGANMSVSNALGGRCARSIDDWHESLVDLLGSSSSERKSAGLAGRQAVERSYSFGAWSDRWRAAVGLSCRNPVILEKK